MASTCEDAVKRIDELSAATQHLLRELGIGRSLSPKLRRTPFCDRTPAKQTCSGTPSYPLVAGRRAIPGLPALPRYEPTAIAGLAQQSTSLSSLPAFKNLQESLASYRPLPLSASHVVLPCGRSVDLRELVPRFADRRTTRNMGFDSEERRIRIAEDLHSGQLFQKVLSVYSSFDPEATSLAWSHGRLRDFVKACFAELALQSPTDSEIYEVYASNFDPELRMSLTALECLGLVEVLLRASLSIHESDDGSFHALDAHAEGTASMESGFDDPTLLAEQWVSEYVPLPVDGTVSIAYSTGVVIHFAEFLDMLQNLATINAPQRSNMLYSIASCDLLKQALAVFKRIDDGSGYLTYRQVEAFVAEVFNQQGLMPPTAGQVAAFYNKFAGPQPRLNASESLCLVDALVRALLHAGTDPCQRPGQPTESCSPDGFPAEAGWDKIHDS